MRPKPNKTKRRNTDGTAFQQLVDKTQRHLLAGQLAGAETSGRRALALEPNHAISHYYLGVALAAQSKPDDAIAHYKRAVDLNQNFAEAHHNLGLMLGKKGFFDDAIPHFERAIALKPKAAEFYTNLGVALMYQGKVEEAAKQYDLALGANPKFAPAAGHLGALLLSKRMITQAGPLLRHALTLEPDNVDFLNNMGVALLEAGRAEEAVPCFERLIELAPTNVDGHNNLGTAYEQSGKLDRALEEYDRASELSPNYTTVYCNRGIAFAAAGRFDEALMEYDKALAIDPGCIEAYFNRGRIKAYRPGDDDIAGMESIAAKNDLDPEKANIIRFALGTALEKKGDYRRAFDYLRQANDLKRSLVPYDEPTVLRSFRHIISTFDRNFFDVLAGAGDPSTTPIFVLGMPRSGTTLLEQILASHPQIHGAGELNALDRAANSIIGTRGQAVNEQELDAEVLQRIAGVYLSLLPSPPEGRTRVVDKLPENFLRIGLIHAVFPNARIIHTMRDPVDTCVSCYSIRFFRGQYFTYNLAELGHYYRSYVELMAHWQSVLPPGRILDVVYENVVDDLEGQARRVIDYCGLPWDDRCLSFHRTERLIKTASSIQVRQPLFRSSLQRWRKYERELGPLLDALGDLAPPSDITTTGA